MALKTLLTAQTEPPAVPHNPGPYDPPAHMPKFLLSDILSSCFRDLNFCYQRGGAEQNRQICDKDLRDCVQTAGLSPEIYWCGPWAYRKDYIEEFIRLFNAGGFRYHDEDWTCHFETKGHDLDSLLDAATLLNDCGACAGQDTCDVSCAVQLGDETLEYPCVKILK